MSASVVEQILARVKAVLLGTTAAGNNLWRRRPTALDDGDLPAIVILRGRSDDAGGDIGNTIQQLDIDFTLECLVVANEAAETNADALHLQAHQLLMADAQLQQLGKATLRCTSTETETDAADIEAARLTAQYRISAFTAMADLTTTY
jgi:hypothetical protein